MNRFSSNSSHARAFTLIELLVVIAIIALLAAILFPVFSRARENARRSSCQSNLKQIGLAIQQYNQDYDGYYPAGNFTSTVPNDIRMHQGHGWASQVQPYAKSWQLFVCPSDNSRRTNSNQRIYSYAYNISLASGPNSHTTSSPARAVPSHDSVLNSPAKTVMLNEVDKVAMSWNGTDRHTPVSNGRVAAMDPANNNTIKFATGYIGPFQDNNWDQFPDREGRHLDGANYLMADGHVKWYIGTSVSPGRTREFTAANSSSILPNTDPYGPSTIAAGTEHPGPAVTFSVR